LGNFCQARDLVKGEVELVFCTTELVLGKTGLVSNETLTLLGIDGGKTMCEVGLSKETDKLDLMVWFFKGKEKFNCKVWFVKATEKLDLEFLKLVKFFGICVIGEIAGKLVGFAA